MEILYTFVSKWPDFIINIIASTLVVIAVLWIERSKRPKIRFCIEADPPVLPGNPQRQELATVSRKFLRVQVINDPMNRFVGSLYTRSPAISCRAWVIFQRTDGSAYFKPGHRMVGRWSNTPEPVSFGITDNTIYQYRDPRLAKDTVDIAAGDSEFLDLVMRSSDSDECVGWHNGIIANPDPRASDQFILAHGTYLVQVRLRTDGRDYETTLKLFNDVSFEHFRLEPK